ncbi:PREDICTED: ER membrane protein complex subunit 2-like [Nicrophorus vespilloides]|uniref:ER membrane protein complex subunit 2 n=1 Tax=Nicrophorus vespilloides TaxID=110193 RepID=A0ABM1MSR3_NICVS|nr:PREDICTED: ER membrane protein complex subunit 2-like [Nicrophorus vespilloides]
MEDLSWSEARDLFRTWRETNARKSNEVLYHWHLSLNINLNKLGNEKFLIVEQVCIAAFDCYQLDVANECIKLLSSEFPQSLRVKKYKAMRYEAQEDYVKALEILDSIIKADKSNSAPKKRKIAILKAQGRYVEAIRELTDYLKTFMADAEAWQELSELYIGEQDFAKAAFCVEELILHNPHNHLLHQRYADIKYTQGGFDNMELARSYYCQALKLNPTNIRALYGLYLTCTSIATSQKASAQKKKDAIKMSEWALTKLKGSYKEKGFETDLESRMSAMAIN